MDPETFIAVSSWVNTTLLALSASSGAEMVCSGSYSTSISARASSASSSV